MVFDWFRRKFDDDKDVTSQPVEPAPTEEIAPESTSVQESSEIPPSPSQELLNWAKAAYVNVQQQSQVSESKIAEPEASELSETPTNELNEPEIVKSAESIEPPIAIALPIEIKLPVEISGLVETAIAEVITPEETDSEATSVPFWMQSESDRMARIAALEATAIVEPEIKSVAAPKRKSTLAFDENFIWSSNKLLIFW